jgi:(2R)-ethylmalonyl-CoA mutase
VQVNSLGLTETQPENNVQRIVLELLGVTLSRDARARAIQLPAWNEALGLPRPVDQQWSLRIQQVLAEETDLLDYPDLFTGSTVMEGLTGELTEAAWAELTAVLELGGAFAAVDELKARLVASLAERTRAIETGERRVVGVNAFTETAGSPLGVGQASVLTVDPAVEAELVADVVAWRAARSAGAVARALDELRRAATQGENVLDATLELAAAGGTTGEWGAALREVWGEFRGPTGLAGGAGRRGAELAPVVARTRTLAGGPPRLLVAKPGLDGHSNGAEQVAVAARDAGFEVVYQGIRQSPAEIAAAARDEDVDLVGVSILSGAHLQLLPALQAALASAGVDAPVVVGGIIPDEDRRILEAAGVAAVFTPRDYDLARVLAQLVDLVETRRSGIGKQRSPSLPNA